MLCEIAEATACARARSLALEESHSDRSVSSVVDYCVDDDDKISSFFFFLNLVLSFFSVIFPQIGDSVAVNSILLLLLLFDASLLTFAKSDNCLIFLTGFKQADATMPLVLNLVCALLEALLCFE